MSTDLVGANERLRSISRGENPYAPGEDDIGRHDSQYCQDVRAVLVVALSVLDAMPLSQFDLKTFKRLEPTYDLGTRRPNGYCLRCNGERVIDIDADGETLYIGGIAMDKPTIGQLQAAFLLLRLKEEQDGGE